MGLRVSLASRSRAPRLDALRIAHTCATLAAAPVLLARKLRKIARNPLAHANELDPARWHCRLRKSAAPRGPARGPHVVLLGKGFGELRLLARVDDALREARPDVRTTWCGQIREFFDGVAAMRPEQATAPIPFDVAPAVTRWLSHVKPDVVVFVEQFRRPALVLGCAARGVRLVAANAVFRGGKPPVPEPGRIERWTSRRIVGAFSALCFQSEEQARLAAPFVPPHVPTIVTGNLKMDLAPVARNAPGLAGLAAWLSGRGERPLLAAGSTRRGDEAFVLEAFSGVRREVPCALLLAPRQLERVTEIEGLVAGAGLSTSRRTAPRAGADVFLLDTVGELAAAYPHAEAAFLGGTLRHRGQNFVEPLLHGLPVSFGSAHVYLAEEQRACVAAGLGARVKSPGDLAEHWGRALRSETRRDEREARAHRFLERHRGAVDRTVEAVLHHALA